MKFTYGLEIEFVDVDRTKVNLPEGCKFNNWEFTLVNSNGIAVDTRKSPKNTIGGEINTKPTNTIEEQVKIAKDCIDALRIAGNPSVNYRCNLHIHIGLPEELHNVKTLQKIQQYAYDNTTQLLLGAMGNDQFEPHPNSTHSFNLHYRERSVRPWRHEMLMKAKTLKEFWAAFFADTKGNYHPVTFHRQAVNTHSFFKTKTIEFRTFYGTLDHEIIRDCLLFSLKFIVEALSSNPMKVENYITEYEFPPINWFDLDLENGFLNTRCNNPKTDQSLIRMKEFIKNRDKKLREDAKRNDAK